MRPARPHSNREGLTDPDLVGLYKTLADMPRPLERLIARCGPKLVNPVSVAPMPEPNESSAKVQRRLYKPNRKLSEEEAQKLVAQYAAGVSITELARRFNTHAQTVDRHLKRQGVEKHGNFRLSAEQVEAAAKLYADGWSTIDIAKKFGIATNTANRALVRAGVTLRTSSEET